MTADTLAWLDSHLVDPAALVADEIVGIGHALAELRSLAGRLRHPEAVRAAGAELPRGILLHGRAGTGKTTAARWLAREVGGDVPVYDLPPDELTAARIKAVFRALAGTRAVLLLDEVDPIAGPARGLPPAARAAQGALLRALDGLEDLTGPVLIGCTTQWPDDLEPALVRPGRLGFHVELRAPSTGDRERLIALLARRRGVEGVLDLRVLAEETEGWTPAEIRQALDDALGLALAAGRTAPAAADLAAALHRDGHVVPEAQVEEGVDWRRVAVHEAGHVAAAVALLGPGSVARVELTPDSGETDLAGDERDLTGSALLDRAAVLYAGMAAERLLLGEASAGSRDDVAEATALLLRRLEAGLDESLAPVALERVPFASERLRQLRDAALARSADRAAQVADAAVADARDGIGRLAERLERDRLLAGAGLAAAIAAAGLGGPAGAPLPGLAEAA